MYFEAIQKQRRRTVDVLMIVGNAKPLSKLQAKRGENAMHKPTGGINKRKKRQGFYRVGSMHLCMPGMGVNLWGESPLGELAQHNKARRFRGQGICGVCARKVHAFPV